MNNKQREMARGVLAQMVREEAEPILMEMSRVRMDIEYLESRMHEAGARRAPLQGENRA